VAIRKHPTKGPGWWIIIISQGRKKKQITYTYEGSEAEALAFEADLRGIPSEAADQRLLDVLGRFLDWYHLHKAKRTAEDAEATLPRIIERIGNRHLSLLRQADWNHYKHTRLQDGVTRRTVNIELTRIRALMTYARDQLQVPIGELPKLYTKKQTEPPPITPLTPDETARLLAQLHGDKRTIVTLYALCGLRRTEGLQLQRKHIDLQARLINVTGKGGKSRVVPIVGDDLYRRLKIACTHYPKIKRGKQIDPADQVREKKQNEYLFVCARTGKPYTNIKKSLKAAAERAGISKPVWNHLMRHSGATAGISAGIDLRSLQVLLGHSDIRMTERYTHLAADMMHQAGNKLAALHDAASRKASEISETDQSKNSKVIPIDRKPRP